MYSNFFDCLKAPYYTHISHLSFLEPDSNLQLPAKSASAGHIEHLSEQSEAHGSSVLYDIINGWFPEPSLFAQFPKGGAVGEVNDRFPDTSETRSHRRTSVQ